jgi:HKD family nuclease
MVPVRPHLRDFLDRGGRLRLLTGDYLGIPDPDALTCLLGRTLLARSLLPLSFHPKAYVFHRADGTGARFRRELQPVRVGALQTGIEWSYRTVSSAEGNALADVAQAFESLFAHPATQELTPDWTLRYRAKALSSWS